MITSCLIAAVTLFFKYAPYIIALKLCTSIIDVAATYAKHRITKQ